MKLDLHSVLIQPLLTEKVTALRESSNTVGFLVHPDANRLQIKEAVETLLKVKVARVNVLNVSIRHARADPGSLLAWAREECFAFVVVLIAVTSLKPAARGATIV